MEQEARILRNFLDQLKRQEAVDEQAPNGIIGEFARLKSQSTKYRTERTYPTKTAERQENIKKNRYKDIVPFDHSRVKLTLTTAKNDTDYINANFIKGVLGSMAYIATQGPLPHTVQDFLRMIWEYNVQIIVMACREFEMGKKKCERYWPLKGEQQFVCEPFTVYCDSEENKGDYLTRMLRVTYHNCSRTLKQLHYVQWPDHGVPDSIPPILEMLHEMRSYQDHDEIPICIHCSAGCGRTGVLCVIDYTWNLLKKQMITSDFNIFNLVQNMRTQRPSVVQTKEQYELVYRTIKLLFQRYLQSMDAQACRHEVTTVPSAIAPDTGCWLLDLNEELDLLTQFQDQLDEEREALVQYHEAMPPTSENHIALRAEEEHMDRQQWEQWHQWQEGPRTSAKQVQMSQRPPAAEESVRENDDMPSLKPPSPPAMAEALCLMVEDPYFDAPMSSLSSEDILTESTKDLKQRTVSPVFNTPSLALEGQNLTSPVSDEEEPPPLPERTPASYELAGDTDPCERLSVIIPPNAAAEAVRELRGCPPSPVPSLPERTPESFELDLDQATVEPNLKIAPAGNLSRVGTSSEWSGNSTPAATASHDKTKSWTRSKSLKVKMSFTAPTTESDVAPNTSSNYHPLYPRLDPLTPPQPPHTDDSLTPPLPGRTLESFILITEQTGHMRPGLSRQSLETTQLSPRAGMSSEWDVSSQPKKFLDVVMTRSKTVRVKGSRSEPLTADQQPSPPPVLVAAAGSVQAGQHDVSHSLSPNAETSGNKPHKSTEKGVSRAKSLKLFRLRQKSKIALPPPANKPATPPPTTGNSFSVFKFGFGNRFGKPKGPRSYPETWI